MAEVKEKVPTIDRVPWRLVYGYLRRNWQEGDHVSVFAPTGGGKTFLCLNGLYPLWAPEWPRLLIDVKEDDPELTRVGRVVRALPDPTNRPERPRIYRLVVPDDSWRTREKFRASMESIIDALDSARRERQWIIHLNEVRALSDPRRPAFGELVRPFLEMLWLRGRPHVTILAETQRPAFVPGSMYDNASHYFFGQGMDEAYAERLKEMGGGSEAIKLGILSLHKHEFVYWHRQTGRLAITRVRERAS